MPGKKPRPWYRTSHRGYYFKRDGKAVLLVKGPEDHATYLKAAGLLSQLLKDSSAPDYLTKVACQVLTPTVAEAAAGYLDLAARRQAAGKLAKHALRNYRTHLKAFVAEFGPKLLVDLTAEPIELWAARPSWSSSYQFGVLGTVCQLLRHYKVKLDPPISRPAMESRASATCLTDPQFQQVLENCYLRCGSKGDLRELLQFLRETGARPAEAAGLSVEGIDWENGLARIERHKTRKKTGKARVLVFAPPALTILERQRQKYGSGLLFRTRGARKAYSPNVVVKQLLQVSERVGFRVIAYGLGRHHYATKALEKGVPPAVVAALLGHKGTAMIERHYGHLGDNARVLREAAEKVSRAG